MLLEPSAEIQKVQDKWNILREEKSRLEAVIRNNNELYAAAWAEYGSELAGPPSSWKEDQLIVKEIEAQMKLLQDFMDGKINFYFEGTLKGNIDRLDSQIQILQVQRNKYQIQLDEINEVRILLS